MADRLLTGERLTRQTRMAIDATGRMAIDRLEELGVSARRPPRPELSERERIVLLHLSHGLSTVEIAARLD
jgi:DNA-binding NarL/FixJ family response regulator